MTPPRSWPNVHDVYTGYVEALEDARPSLSSARLRSERVHAGCGSRGLERLSRSRSLPPPSTHDEVLALGALQEARSRGSKSRGDRSRWLRRLPVSMLVEPALTTVSVPSREIGMRGMRTLNTLMSGRRPRPRGRPRRRTRHPRQLRLALATFTSTGEVRSGGRQGGNGPIGRVTFRTPASGATSLTTGQGSTLGRSGQGNERTTGVCPSERGSVRCSTSSLPSRFVLTRRLAGTIAHVPSRRDSDAGAALDHRADLSAGSGIDDPRPRCTTLHPERRQGRSSTAPTRASPPGSTRSRPSSRRPPKRRPKPSRKIADLRPVGQTRKRLRYPCNVAATSDYRILRVGAVAAVAGALAQLVATVSNTDWSGEPGDAVQVVADSGLFTANRVVDLIGVLLTVAGAHRRFSQLC